MNLSPQQLEAIVYTTLIIFGGIVVWYIAWGLKIKWDTREGAVLVRLWDKKHTQRVYDYIQKPDINGYCTINGAKYKIDTTISDQIDDWPGGAPGILRVPLAVSWHFLGCEQAMPLSEIDQTKYMADSAVERALADSNEVWMWLIEIAKRSGLNAKDKLLSLTNILVAGALLVGLINIYYLWKMKDQIAFIAGIAAQGQGVNIPK